MNRIFTSFPSTEPKGGDKSATSRRMMPVTRDSVTYRRLDDSIVGADKTLLTHLSIRLVRLPFSPADYAPDDIALMTTSLPRAKSANSRETRGYKLLSIGDFFAPVSLCKSLSTSTSAHIFILLCHRLGRFDFVLRLGFSDFIWSGW